MLTARDIMTPAPITATPDTNIEDVAKLLLEHRINGLPVVDESGQLIGVICQSDLVAQQQKFQIPSVFSLLDGFIQLPVWGSAEKNFKKMIALTVEDAMTRNPVTASPDDKLDTLATLMVQSKYYSLPVVENNKLVGIIGKEDILRTIIKR